jgi:hypothetical protein
MAKGNRGIAGVVAKQAKTAEKTEAAPPAVEKRSKTNKATPKASTREGTKVISGHYPESAYKQFKVAATMDGMSLQDALAKALNLYLEDQNMAPVFPINKPKM